MEKGGNLSLLWKDGLNLNYIHKVREGVRSLRQKDLCG